MTVRLSHMMRTHIATAMLDARFKAEEEALKEEAPSIGDKMYRALVPDWRKAQHAPDGWLRLSNAVNFYNEKGYRNWMPMTKERPFPYKYEEQLNAEAQAIYYEYTRRKDALKEKRSELGRQVMATLTSFKTIDKLVKDWPEVKPFLPKDLAPTTTALAIPLKSLNEQLRLT